MAAKKYVKPEGRNLGEILCDVKKNIARMAVLRLLELVNMDLFRVAIALLVIMLRQHASMVKLLAHSSQAV